MDTLSSYLDGTAFSDSYWYNPALTADELKFRLRDDLLCELVQGKTICHIGCTDHIPLIEQKIRNNQWLHAKLSKIATYCIGIDIDQEAIAKVNQLGFDNVVYYDVYQASTRQGVDDVSFDYILIPEVIEHIDDPIRFLQQVQLKLNKSRTAATVISVPNAFRLPNFVKALSNIEPVNTDHRYWFTPYTLRKITFLAGLRQDKLFMVNNGNEPGISGWGKQQIAKRFPFLRNSLVSVTTAA